MVVRHWELGFRLLGEVTWRALEMQSPLSTGLGGARPSPPQALGGLGPVPSRGGGGQGFLPEGLWCRMGGAISGLEGSRMGSFSWDRALRGLEEGLPK